MLICLLLLTCRANTTKYSFQESKSTPRISSDKSLLRRTLKPHTTLEDYSDAPFGSVDGTIIDGVGYSFTIGGLPHSDAAVTNDGPGTITYIERPNIEGAAFGVLKLVFEQPTTIVKFGLALSTGGHHQEAAEVSLFRPGAGHIRGTVLMSTSSDPHFTEGLFEYRGPAVKTVEITFNAELNAQRFAFDNLEFHKGKGKGEGSGSDDGN